MTYPGAGLQAESESVGGNVMVDGDLMNGTTCSLTEEQLRAAAGVLAEALREYAEIHPTTSRDYGRGFAMAYRLLEDWATPAR